MNRKLFFVRQLEQMAIEKRKVKNMGTLMTRIGRMNVDFLSQVRITRITQYRIHGAGYTVENTLCRVHSCNVSQGESPEGTTYPSPVQSAGFNAHTSLSPVRTT